MQDRRKACLMTTPEYVSVIIPVYNDWERLSRCVRALTAQTFTGSVEIIVVDNNSSHPPPETLTAHPNTTIIHCERAGSYAARNKGIEAASAEILAFTDADCEPNPEWLEHGLKALQENPAADAIAGRIVVVAQHSPPTMIEVFDTICGFPQNKYVEHGFGATANLFVRRRVFPEIGLFDERYLSGGDKEWGKRLTNADYKLIYAPDVVIKHPARATTYELRKKITRFVGGLYTSISQSWKGLYLWPSLILPPGKPLLLVIGINKLSVWSRIQVTLILSLVWYFKVSETLRLLLGGKPTRA